MTVKKKLVPFESAYSLDDFDRKPLPDDIFNSEGAILAHRGHSLSRDRLAKVFVYVDDVYQAGAIPDGPDGPSRTAAADPTAPDSAIQRALREKEEESRSRPGYELTDTYEEETAQKIEHYLTEIEFEPIPKIKTALRTNIHSVKEIFQRKIINNMVFLVSHNNERITTQIAEYLNQILETNLFASDYLDMITAVRTRNNYVTFSHALATAFYAMAIAKKLRMLREDYLVNDNLGRWVPVKTRTNARTAAPVPFSGQLLKYIDRQKSTILIKYDSDVKEVLFERIHDLMHEYAALDPRKRSYPSLSPAYDDGMLRTLTMAAINCDIGKLCIPNRILNKPGALTEEEWEVIRHHPALGVAKLKEVNVNLPKMFAYIIGHHILDSKTGYPAVKGTVPPETRIVTVSDIYDAMTAPKHYGKQQSNAQATQHMKELLDRGLIDLPLYLAAVHTFGEYNHEFVKRRHKKISDADASE